MFDLFNIKYHPKGPRSQPLVSRLSSLVFLLLPTLTPAQSPWTYPGVEQTSRILYDSARWEQLLTFGNKALERDIDYLALRYRMGVAAFSLGKYERSAGHLEEALAFNRADETVQEYLFYAYRYSLREGAAYRAARDFSPGLKARLGIPARDYHAGGWVGAGWKISSLPDRVSNLGYLSAGIIQRPSYTLHLRHQVGWIRQTYLGLDFNQYQYFLGGQYQAAPDFRLEPALHLLYASGDGQRPEADNTTTNALRQWGALLHLGARFDRPGWSWRPSLTWSFLPTRWYESGRLTRETTFDQWQPGLDIELRPHARWLIGLGGYTILSQEVEGGAWVAGRVRWTPTRAWVLEAHLASASGVHTAWEGGAIWDNNAGALGAQYGLSATRRIGARSWLQIGWQWEERFETDFDWTNNLVFTNFNLIL